MKILLYLMLYFLLVPNPSWAEVLVLHDVRVDVYFSPKGGAEQGILQVINNAQQEICIQAYSFTSQPIADALVAAFQRGVIVRVILDKSQMTATSSKRQTLQQAGIFVLIDGIHAIAHNKVMVIDNRWVITGSFNFTKSAEERNAENLLIIDSRALSKRYRLEFELHMAHALREMHK